MSYEMVNEELNIKSCSLADLTMEQVHHFLKIWDDGSAIGTLALFFDKDGTLVLNRDNEHYSDYQEIAEGLLKLDLEQADQVVESAPESIKETVEVIRRCMRLENGLENMLDAGERQIFLSGNTGNVGTA